MPRIDSEKLYAHIKSKAGRVKCPVCRRGPMSFSDAVYGVSEVWTRPNLEKNIVTLVVPLRCQNCGGVSFIDPTRVKGAVIYDEEPDNEEKDLK